MYISNLSLATAIASQPRDVCLASRYEPQLGLLKPKHVKDMFPARTAMQLKTCRLAHN